MELDPPDSRSLEKKVRRWALGAQNVPLRPRGLAIPYFGVYIYLYILVIVKHVSVHFCNFAVHGFVTPSLLLSMDKEAHIALTNVLKKSKRAQKTVKKLF